MDLAADGLAVGRAGLRCRGLGARLLSEAERLAIARGCDGAMLSTFDFQARVFYERQGCVVYGAARWISRWPYALPPAERPGIAGGARNPPHALRIARLPPPV
ncbi:MAG: Acetyltransferase [Gemmatimonadetes bacterium]|nr:Acetyltransferase [Gemmatimonadota bacterium]